MSLLFDFIQRGGLLMLPIVLCSIIGLAIFIDRSVRLRRSARANAAFLDQIRGNIRVGKIEDSLEICKSSQSPIAAVFAAGLRRVGDGEAATRQAIEDAGRKETAELEKHLGGLATIAGGAPLLGFLGTVLGMIGAFQTVERLGGNVNASVLAGGIWQALLTTAAGLAVAVPAFFAHNFLYDRIQSQVHAMEERSRELMLLLVTGDESIL
ncbi:MAG: MotA/TolQ/ExbB proton channel family protein [Candidatus Eisenbacteria bacterium]|uniref:MotA/TolQ/ExbB proton channel family protein n=1 Tax=Eiseniibacteriota bacterium TaxID=2212470 RepID=A0A956N8H1_UNCEI|nr:MotA/TolQ/ExbB proton channel family protein [Candidatus Eisenbacteria bacterium]MCB9463010.1 MotA/TolQ/ExbB proton channel family protein [Candidatus Eisenbacteria bacterium]